jgi:hypothetical protein
MFEIDQIKHALEAIANQAINAIDPGTIEQGIDNLKGLKILVDSSLSFHTKYVPRVTDTALAMWGFNNFAFTKGEGWEWVKGMTDEDRKMHENEILGEVL